MSISCQHQQSSRQQYQYPLGSLGVDSSPVSSTSTSLSSSFCSAASDMHPAVSSQSDILSDHSASTGSAQNARAQRLAHPTSMGQGLSSSPSPSPIISPPISQKSLGISAAAATTGLKLKRAFAKRRKNSEDATKVFSAASGTSTSDGKSPSSSCSGPIVPVPTSKASRGPKLTLQLATQVLSGGKKSVKSPVQGLSPFPPSPPPKPPSMQGKKVSIGAGQVSVKADHRGSTIPLSPGISSAIAFMRMDEEERVKLAKLAEKERGQNKDRDKELAVGKTDIGQDSGSKETWRKSDSTIGQHTVRQTAGNLASRPVSIAESLHSTHTIVPVGKRMSPLITDIDLIEEDGSSNKSQDGDVSLSASSQESPDPSSRSKNRRSMSMNLGPTQSKGIPPSWASSSVMPSKSMPDSHRLNPSVSSRETPTLTRTAANGIISPSSSGLQSTGHNIRGRLVAWSATASRQERSLPTVPPSTPISRHTALSVSTSFAPAAGLAKRAVEKMGRAWGGFASSSSASGYASSSSSNGPPSSYSDHALARTSSPYSNGGPHSLKGKSRRTPDAPSGAWSIGSSTGSSSLSDSEAIAPSGPSLGKMLRGPLRPKTGLSRGGVVFGRDLRSVVRETAVGAGLLESYTVFSTASGHLKDLETRMLPALVVRCAQHLLLWGVQEEGLFRVSGRPSHVTKVRTEFDYGGDFDLRGCSPGELDPHAVASVFKAFLRELPEPVLTRALIPYFDAALAQETSANNSQQASTHLRGGEGRSSSLPSGPKSGFLRKPPSLSTLALPNFTGAKQASPSLLNALRALVAQLPAENRDLIRTVTELINATASEHKATKMPLSNLLVVFCPSLNMNPPLLRVLCEAQNIWDPAPDPPVLDIKREDTVLDISSGSGTARADLPDESSSVEGREQTDSQDCDQFHDAQSELDETPAADVQVDAARPPSLLSRQIDGSLRPSEDCLGASIRPSEELSPPSSADGQSKRNMFGRVKPMGPRNAHAAPRTVSGDNVASLNDPSSSLEASPVELPVDDAASSVASSKDYSRAISPPPLSSSAESLATPSSAEAHFDNFPTGVEKGGSERSPPFATVKNMPSSSSIASVNALMQFPSIESPPGTPLSHRKSDPILTLPNFSNVMNSSNGSPSSAPSSPLRRIKKPSLHLLFTKRSASPLTTPSSSGRPYISSPYVPMPSAGSDSTDSTPVTAVTAPQSSPYTITTTITSSPLSVGLNLNPDTDVSPEISNHAESATAHSTSDDLGSSHDALYRIGETPIADHYKSASKSTLSLGSSSPDSATSSQQRHTLARERSSSQLSYLSTESSNHLGLLDDRDDPEEWTRSVLMAADFDVTWNPQSS